MGREKLGGVLKEFDKKLVLEDGSEYQGFGFGYDGEALSEIVFNTSMVGYQKILYDPSYAFQSVVMTYTLIGNYGVADDNYEGIKPAISGLIVREYNDLPSNFNSKKTLDEVMKENGITGIYGLDTRKLTRRIRDGGSCKAIITDISTSKEEALKKIEAFRLPENQVATVSCKSNWFYRTFNNRRNVVVVDCGVKADIISVLNERGCNVTVVPWDTGFEDIKKIDPDGVLISNGPGNPEVLTPIIELIKELKGKYPVSGIGLGFQLIALAYGAKTYKLKVGHRGCNYPVRELKTGEIRIANQNHGYAVDIESLEDTGLTLTHVNIMDKSAAGAESAGDKVFGIQFYPDSLPGVEESDFFFDKFNQMLSEVKKDA